MRGLGGERDEMIRALGLTGNGALRTCTEMHKTAFCLENGVVGDENPTLASLVSMGLHFLSMLSTLHIHLTNR